MNVATWSRALAAFLLLVGVTAPLAAAEKIGLVLLHGKLGGPATPSSHTLTTYPDGNGILVEAAVVEAARVRPQLRRGDDGNRRRRQTTARTRCNPGRDRRPQPGRGRYNARPCRRALP
jgi:hypothetical protein